MYIRVSKAMLKEIKKNIKAAAYCVDSVVYREMSPQEYKYSVDIYPFNHEEDYDCKKGAFKVLCVIYKDDCYAMNKYITTRDLNTCFRDCDKSYEDFFYEVNNMIMI